MKKILAVVAVLVVAFFGIQIYGNQETKDAADDAVDGAKDAADEAGKRVNPDTAVDGAKDASDYIAGMPESFWRIVVPLLLVGGAAIWVWKDAKRRSIALTVAVIALIVFIISSTTA